MNSRDMEIIKALTLIYGCLAPNKPKGRLYQNVTLSSEAADYSEPLARIYLDTFYAVSLLPCP